VFPDESREGAQCVVSLGGVWESGGDVGIEDDDGASGGVARGEFVGRGAAEIVFRKNLIGGDPAWTGGVLSGWFLHKSFARDGWRGAR